MFRLKITSGAGTTTAYFQHADGSVIRVVRSGTLVADVLCPKGAVEITEDDRQAAVAEVTAANDTYVEQLLAQEAKVRQSDFEGLLAAGIPESTARRLLGHYEDDES